MKANFITVLLWLCYVLISPTTAVISGWKSRDIVQSDAGAVGVTS